MVLLENAETGQLGNSHSSHSQRNVQEGRCDETAGLFESRIRFDEMAFLPFFKTFGVSPVSAQWGRALDAPGNGALHWQGSQFFLLLLQGLCPAFLQRKN